MAPWNRPLPKKLAPDAILEALFEVRFEPEGLPESVAARLLTSECWNEFVAERMPAYEIPPRFRELDPNLRYQPTHQLKSRQGGFNVRIGGHVLSCHVVKPYPGWTEVRRRLGVAASALEGAAPGARLSRLGLRYLNSLEPQAHGIESVGDLDLEVQIAGERVRDDVNVSLHDTGSGGLQCTTRIATRRFINPTPPENVKLFIDVDVYEELGEGPKMKVAGIPDWLEPAHELEKRHFFHLLREQDIERLAKETL